MLAVEEKGEVLAFGQDSLAGCEGVGLALAFGHDSLAGWEGVGLTLKGFGGIR